MKILFLAFVLIFQQIPAWRIFHKGRIVGGNLGEPEVVNQHARKISIEWFDQNLDHFNPTNEKTWKQRYFVNDEFFGKNPNGPVFLMIGGEGNASDKWMTQGSWVDYGKKFGALLFQLEHRFYGESHPTKDLSVENLRFLTSQQALADLTNFISAMNEKYQLPRETKWIAFGGSYPGSLAAWLRYKYPHLVHGSMSASGPLLAQVDFKDYFNVVVESLGTHSNECVQSTQSAFKQIVLLLKEKIGQKNLNKLFRLCDPIENALINPNDISNLFETLAGNFAGVVQYNKDNRLGSAKGVNITIDTICDLMVNQSAGTPVFRLAQVNDLLLNAYEQKCLDFKYQTMIDALKNESWESGIAEGGRQWNYQTCTEFGFFQTSSNIKEVFGDEFPVDFFVQQCQDIFGAKFNSKFLNEAIQRTNMLYGALDIEVSNVVFVHGSIDPWHALGITKTVNQGAPAIYIKGTAHCANMYPKSDKDLPQLNAARVQIEQLIDSWLRL